jgi:hypothetical protein
VPEEDGAQTTSSSQNGFRIQEDEPEERRQRRQRTSEPAQCRIISSSGNRWVPCPR